MKKNVVSLLLALCLLMLPFSTAAAQGPDGTAVVPVQDSGSLREAILQASGETVIQLTENMDFGTLSPKDGSDIQTGITIPKGKTIVLDLNGYSLTAELQTNGSTYGAAQVIRNEGTLTITDSSEAKTGSIKNMENGSSTYGCTAVIRNQEGTLTIDGGSISCWRGNAIRNQNGLLTVNGGTLTTTGEFASFDNGTTVIHNRGDLVITGGVFEAEHQADVWYGLGTDESTTVISGGKFRSMQVNIQGGDGTVSVTGGSFGVDPSDYVVPGYYANSNGAFYVVEAAGREVEVSTGEELAAALEDTSGTSNIHIVGDVTLSGDLTVAPTACLYVDKGASLSFEDGAVLRLEGYLCSAGTIDFAGIGSGFVSNLFRYVDLGGSFAGLPQADETGTYEISAPMQLQLLHFVMLQNADQNGVFHGDIVLTEDLDLSGYSFLPLGFDCAVAFSGHFDGRGHTIKGLTIERAAGNLGLFSVTENADFSNLTFEDASLDTQSGVMGTIAGNAVGSGTFCNISVSGRYENDASYYCGGWFGFMTGGETDAFNFINCSNHMDVQGCYNVGAFWGSSSGSKADVTMVNCSNSGDVSASGGTVGIAGGYVYNSAHQGTLYNFTNTGTISSGGTEVNNPSIFNGNKPQQTTQTVAACLVEDASSPVRVYETAAYAVAEKNGTVYLTQDVTEDLTVALGSDLTIEGGLHTLSGSITAETSANGSDAVSLTLRNLTLEGGNTAAPAVSSVNYGADSGDGEKVLNEVSSLQLAMTNCTVQHYSQQAMHVTNAASLLVDDCTFHDNADAGTDFVMDLDLCAVQDAEIEIRDTSFDGTGDKAAIRVAARGGESDISENSGVPNIATEGNQEASIDSLTVTGCSFAEGQTAITLGVDSQADNNRPLEDDDSPFAENTTGSFQVTISGNTTDVLVDSAHLTYQADDGNYYLAQGNGREESSELTVPNGETAEKTPDGSLTIQEEPDDKPSGGSSSDDSSVGSPLPTVPTEPGEPSDPTDPSTPSGFVSDTTDDLTVNGTYQFRITSLDGTIPFLTVDNANFRVEFASQEGNDFFFKIHAQGAAGSTTVVSVNGVRLLTATVGGSATGVISDTTAPFTVKKGETYQFRLTASERPSFAAGSASFTVEYAGQIGSDYFYKVYAAGNVGDGCGFYINGEASPVAVATIA